ncbi:UNVERIFIED_CONTAM: putative NOT transcription complex subunit VIP2 [Sesamum radiatum]|uniref:NOT transcription complex subunit VIP2 n=1 Tax=Sesamum radiatum TaxID=300843 RepID=A0AAW2L081_SESRA
MSGILSSGLNGSNSNLPDNTGRAFATSFSAQSGSSGAVLNQSGGNIQGLHNIHGNFNMSNMPGPYASRNSANLAGLPNGVQQAPGSVSNGRYTINSLPNALSQLSLGSSHGHSGVTNTGVHTFRPRCAYKYRKFRANNKFYRWSCGWGNTSRGASSAGVANIPGLASRLNLTDFSAPQVVSMLGNSYSGAGVPLSQNQFQAGNNNFSFMALLNDSNAHDSATFDVNDFPQLSGRPPSAGGSHGQIGLMQKHNIGFGQQNQEFSIQNEDFPALPGYKGGLNVGGSAEYTVNTHQKEQIHDSMANLMQSQQLSMGRSSGFNFGGSFSSHHPQQHRASSINGTGVSYLTSGNQDLHFHGPEQYQQFQQSQSRFINPFRDKEMKSTQGSQSVPDQYGMLGLLSIIKMVNPALTSLALGIDLTTLGLNLNSSETLHKKFASPWSDEPVRGEPEYSVPECYYAKQTPPLKQTYFARFRPETLFYIFYSMPKDEAQLFAANELCNRGWFYHRELRLWFTRVKNMEPLVKTNTYERGCYFCFDPNTWQTARKDNFVLQYEMVEKRPSLPQQ